MIVEVMGGDEPARTLTAAALGAGKPVVSANKHVVAHHGAELEALARRTGSAFRFEAAVGGGTPVLGPLAAELAADRIDALRGIVNGTTNHILTGDDERRAGLRGRPRRGPGGRLRGGRPERRRRGRRRRQQARHPGPARVRDLARPGLDRPPPADRRRRRPAGHHRRRGRRAQGRRRGRSDDQAPRGARADARTGRSRRACSRPRSHRTARSAGPAVSRTGSRSTPNRSAAWPSPGRAPAGRRRAARSWATSSPSPGTAAAPGPASPAAAGPVAPAPAAGRTRGGGSSPRPSRSSSSATRSRSRPPAAAGSSSPPAARRAAGGPRRGRRRGHALPGRRMTDADDVRLARAWSNATAGSCRSGRRDAGADPRRGVHPARPRPALGRELGLANLYLKVEGAQPDRQLQGPRDGRRREPGARGRGPLDRLRLDRQHLGLGGRLRRGRRARGRGRPARRARSRPASCSRR